MNSEELYRMKVPVHLDSCYVGGPIENIVADLIKLKQYYGEKGVFDISLEHEECDYLSVTGYRFETDEELRDRMVKVIGEAQAQLEKLDES